MKLYDLVCECGWSEDDVLLRAQEREAARCPECDRPLRHRLGVPHIGGQAQLTSFGMSLGTEREAERWRAEHQAGSVVLEGREKTAYIDRVREKGEATARAMGYRDMEHRSEDCKRITADQTRIAREGRKPFSLPK